MKNVNKLEKLLKKSVDNITKDKNKTYGIWLSGGIDSSLLNTFFNFKNIYTYDYDGDYEEEFKKKFPEIIKVIGKPIKSRLIISHNTESYTDGVASKS